MVHPLLDKLPEQQRKIADNSKEAAPSVPVTTPAKSKPIRTRPPPQPVRFRPQSGRAAAQPILLLHQENGSPPQPPLEKPQILVQFRHSMRKFKVGSRRR